ncbi:MAG: type IX secretion system protein PorQ [Bacteroidales bacterium]|nr:type IX secretion system protein PorQ [Bacteroidales bacterium]
MSRIRFVLFVVLYAGAYAQVLQAQIGGTSVYGFLDLTPSPMVAALGGKVNAVSDSDPALAFYNPALLDSISDNTLSLNYVHFMADIRFGYAAYARSYQNAGNFAIGIHYVNYGRFTEADMTGNITGSFTAAEYAFNLTYARRLSWRDSTFAVGVNLKPLLSVFERYSSYGLLADVGMIYRHPDKLTEIALVIRNMGGQMTTYAQSGREAVPFEVQLGVSQQLQNAPFRFSVVLQHLERLRLGYDDPAVEESARRGVGLVADEAMRHIVVGVECTPFRGLTLRGGYNYHRRQEMKLASHAGLAGFSMGVGVRVSRFHVDYARSKWHVAGASNHFSVHVDLK